MEAFIVSAIVSYKTKQNDKNYLKKVPIKKIDGIDVNAEIRLCRWGGMGDIGSWTYYLVLVIKSADFYLDEHNEDQVVLFRKSFGKTNNYKQGDILGLKRELETAVKMIKTLRLDTLRGHFKEATADETPSDSVDMEMYKLLKDAEGEEGVIEYEIEECSVCYTPTYTTTGCGHSVCMRCISKIEKTYDDEIDDDRQKCPMCRETIMNLEYVHSEFED